MSEPNSSAASDSSAEVSSRAAIELDEVRLVVSNGVAQIILDRPKVMNVLSDRPGGTRDQIVAALEAAESDESVGCVVIWAEGKAFCGGGDLTGNKPRENAGQDRLFVERAEAFHRRLREAAVPTIAAVHGYCLGAGVAFATSCDIVLAADNAKFGFPEGRLGLVGASAVVNTVGVQWAKFMILSGENLDADQAVSLGLALKVEPADDLVARTLDLAGRISRMPREGTLLNRRSINAVADASGDSAGRAAAQAADTATLSAAAIAKAPDGRTFRSIIQKDGISGLKEARLAQYDSSWLR